MLAHSYYTQPGRAWRPQRLLVPCLIEQQRKTENPPKPSQDTRLTRATLVRVWAFLSEAIKVEGFPRKRAHLYRPLLREPPLAQASFLGGPHREGPSPPQPATCWLEGCRIMSLDRQISSGLGAAPALYARLHWEGYAEPFTRHESLWDLVGESKAV